MYKKIALILSCVLILFISILGIRMVQNIRIKREVLEANKIFNEQNEIYINRDEELGSIEYKSNTMSINILPIKKTNPNINMWEVNIKISSGSQIKSAFADDKFNLRNREKTSNIAKRHNAILAINGAAAGFNKSSYVIRDSIIYRDTRLDCAPLVIQKDGDFRMYDDHLSGEELVERGAMHTYDFGPDLIRGGEIVDYGNTWYKEGLDPRTVIGQKGPLEYVILVVDGRSEESVGMSLYDTAVELKNRGCYWGYNLDGGGSTTLYFNGEVLNTPSDWNGERKISDILYFVD
ncbi:phosphodiester glycosidase family protein [Clostridium perfringens]|uniref:phosphodiester glycosidase family protein n=1 Tax=Clostridium perfringens TaxID=1502 RepID=UPI0018E41198|nr:phosphodiester glycosidase family protein [Clostridium perfringens]MBI5987094.1 phosphodiester glycosidase family protein [Clostridium perfringens]MDK0601192.1 phosphodiester glycosidase family protein [Clostridium perfringens]MDK0604072.1 phosphodiester glycosidase family protein [Clostridium perfringens]MDM0668106.1 phosphodiester glycosidase family protein [Clostridium perfringens]MDM0674340.1 phosphodiester glycosidase family protein [Clostridium perfringens]